MTGRAARMRAMVAASGTDFWINEMGYADYRFARNKASLYGTSVFYDYEHTPQYQAEALLKMHALAAAGEQASLTVWYRIDDFAHSDKRMPLDKVHSHLGVVDVNGKAKPALEAMREAQQLFREPVRVLDTEVLSDVKDGDSQAEVLLFQRRTGELLLLGWLRSSMRGEVSSRTGFARDPRVEHVSVAMPCRDARVTERATDSRSAPGHIEDIRLRSDKVLVLHIECSK